jgi:hypothetical protein
VMKAVPALFSCAETECTDIPPGPPNGRPVAPELVFDALAVLAAVLAALLVAIPLAAPTSAHVAATAIAPAHVLRLMQSFPSSFPAARVVAGSGTTLGQVRKPSVCRT